MIVGDYAAGKFRATTHLVWDEGFGKSGFGAGREYKHGSQKQGWKWIDC
jgi:hypothetical protein